MSAHFEIPRPSAVLRHAVPHLVEATLIPLGIFYLFFWIVGVWGALFAGLAWSWGAIARRVVTGRRVPGILGVGATLLTVRTLVACLSGSVYLYFLQPTLGTFAVAGAFLLSVPVGQPLAQRLAADFCPIPPSHMARPFMRRFFMRVSLLWAFAYTVNAMLTLWLLFSQPVETYVYAKALVSFGVTGTAVLMSTLWFWRSMRLEGIPVRFAPRPAVTGTPDR